MSSIERIKEIAAEAKKIAQECSSLVNLQGDYAKLIDECVKTLLECDKPYLTVCGVYSAGKSTIVNVLCRKDVAAVGAQPKTDKVAMYTSEHKNYTIVDTPGVDAPIEHEKITDDFIRKSSALMFVVSSKNAESEANYRKINEWMEYEKPLVIVLNDKGGEGLESKEIETIRLKIEENLRRSGYDRDKKYDVIAVNAKMAQDALDKGKQQLFVMSNMLSLEALLDAKMKESFSLYLAPIGELERNLDGLERSFRK